MKRMELVRHLQSRGCEFPREGGNRTIDVNRLRKQVSTVPGPREIIEFTARKIHIGLGIPAT